MLIEQRLIETIRPYENNPRQNEAGIDASLLHYRNLAGVNRLWWMKLV